MKTISLESMMKCGFVPVDYVVDSDYNSNFNEAIPYFEETIDNDKRGFTAVDFNKLEQVYTDYPQLRPFLFLTTSFHGVILFNQETLLSVNANFLFAFNKPIENLDMNDEIDTVLKQISVGLPLTDFSSITPNEDTQPDEHELLESLIRVVDFNETAFLESLSNLVDFNNISSTVIGLNMKTARYDEIKRYFYLKLYKRLEFPTPEFYNRLISMLRTTRYEPSFITPILGNYPEIEETAPSKAVKLFRGDTLAALQKDDQHTRKSVSWSTDFEQAEFFAQRFSEKEVPFPGSRKVIGQVTEMWVPKEYILAVYHQDSENEVLVDPAIWKNENVEYKYYDIKVKQ